MADVVPSVEEQVPEDVQIPADYDGDCATDDGSPINRCIGTPSVPGSPEQPCGIVGPSGFGELTDGQGNMQGMQWVPATGWDCSAEFSMPMAVCGDYMAPCGVDGMGGWGLQQVMDPSTGCAQWMVPFAAGPGCGGCCGEDGSGGYASCEMPPEGGAVYGEQGADAARLGEQYSSCFKGAGDGEEVSVLRKRLHESQRQHTQMQRSWERERKGLMREIERYRAVLLRYAIPVEEVTDRAIMPSFPPNKGQSSDSKAYGYNDCDGSYDNYYKEDGYHTEVVEPTPMPTSTGGTESTGTPCDESNSNRELSEDGTTKIATELKAMFPGKSVCTWSELEPRADALAQEYELRPQCRDNARSGDTRRRGSMSSVRVQELAKRLEASTRSDIDERAMEALQTLSVASALDALQRVDHVIRSQGGSCRNLSSILQSVCRKFDRKGPRDFFRREHREQTAVFEGSRKVSMQTEEAASSASMPSPTHEPKVSNHEPLDSSEGEEARRHRWADME